MPVSGIRLRAVFTPIHTRDSGDASREDPLLAPEFAATKIRFGP
jgi:hypothetical protein